MHLKVGDRVEITKRWANVVTGVIVAVHKIEKVCNCFNSDLKVDMKQDSGVGIGGNFVKLLPEQCIVSICSSRGAP